MPTTSQILGYTPQDINSGAFTAAGEAGPGRDYLGVLQTIIARKQLEPKASITDLVTRPQQFVANARYNPQQVADANFGRKIYGARYDQIRQALENAPLMGTALQEGQAATSFRGQALIKNKLPSDYMFDKLGNFYYDTKPSVANTTSARLLQGAVGGDGGALGPMTAPPAPVESTSAAPQITPEQFLMNKVLENALSSSATPTPWNQSFDQINKDLAATSTPSVDYFSPSNLRSFGIKMPLMPNLSGS